MTAKRRLTKLEAVERAALIAQLEALEATLSARLTDDQRFAVMTCLVIGDTQRDELLEMDEDEFRQELTRRRQAKSLNDLRADISGLQWAIQQFDEYEANHPNSD